MIRTLTGLVPFAAAVAVFGIVVAVLLDRHMAIGTWLLAAFLVGHGLVHLLFVMPRPTPTAAAANDVEFPFDLGRSWLLSRVGIEGGQPRTVGVALIGAVLVGYVLAGLATIGLLLPMDWWPGLVLASTAASALLIGLFAQLGLLVGLSIDAVLLWVVLASAWSPTPVA